jgi:hypothetical protein
MNPSRRSLLLVAGGVLLLAMSGCSTIGAKPWERGRLARESMQMDDHAVEAGIDDHVYFSKEASSGGRGFGGGGCGCN